MCRTRHLSEGSRKVHTARTAQSDGIHGQRAPVSTVSTKAQTGVNGLSAGSLVSFINYNLWASTCGGGNTQASSNKEIGRAHV